jgi:alginate O-acetyltransferase complex protein AlgI
MVFNSSVFLFAFLPVVFTAFWLARTRPQRYVILTVSGYVFYGYWNWRFCLLLLFSSLVSFMAGIMIDRSPSPAARRAWLVGSVATDLSLLGFFKYYNFLAANLAHLMPGAAPPLLDIVLPIGISFYTFHTISYIVDVAEGRVRATHDLFEYLAYVSLFSQLVAGPIIRFREIEEDLERIDGPPREDNMARGIGLFVCGLVKKAIIADSIASWIDPMLAVPQSLSTAGAWCAALGYALQLYYDFSGYSDMAMGLGSMFGLRIPHNFHSPYQAAGISDFWRRWHISLSRWLRDYLYVPLGGNRKGEARTYVNLLVTMLLGGLWHGAAWTFVVWGAYHGALLALGRVSRPLFASVPDGLKRAGTFLLVLVGWVIFRSTDFSMAAGWLGRMVGIGAGSGVVPAALVVWVAGGLVLVSTLPEPWEVRMPTRMRWAPLYATAFLVAYLFVNQQQTVFLYYQF